jgi:hypothetical protein
MKAAALLLEEVWVPEESPWFDATPCNNIHACIIPELKPFSACKSKFFVWKNLEKNSNISLTFS